MGGWATGGRGLCYGGELYFVRFTFKSFAFSVLLGLLYLSYVPFHLHTSLAYLAEGGHFIYHFRSLIPQIGLYIHAITSFVILLAGIYLRRRVDGTK